MTRTKVDRKEALCRDNTSVHRTRGPRAGLGEQRSDRPKTQLRHEVLGCETIQTVAIETTQREETDFLSVASSAAVDFSASGIFR